MTQPLDRKTRDGSVSIPRLVARQDKVHFNCGRFVIEPASKLPVPSNWYKAHKSRLICEALSGLGMDAYQYMGYTTGHYGRRKRPGITLQFKSVPSRVPTYVIFNCKLTRRRNSKHGKRGDPFPEKQFYVSKSTAFYNFWVSTGLAMPKSLAVFHDYMGKLKALLFIGDLHSIHKTRLNAGSLRPLSVPAEVIRRAFLPNNIQTESRQNPDKRRICVPDNDFPPAQQPRGLQQNSATGQNTHGNTVYKDARLNGANELPLDYKAYREELDHEWRAYAGALH